MKFRTLSRIVAAAFIAGGAYAAAPAAYAEDAPQPAAEQPAQAKSPFDEKVLEQHVMATVARFEKGDIDGLQAEATQDMRAQLTADQVNAAKAQFAPKWGARVSSGKMYMTSGQENGAWYAVCEIAVGYKETVVVYRLSYDANMNLAGIFIR